ncbi:MAG: M56 family metallopeptidase [Bacteroidales bacterium]
MTLIKYLSVSGVSLVLFYSMFRLVCNKSSFKGQRFYLLASMAVSLVLPLNSFDINIVSSSSDVKFLILPSEVSPVFIEGIQAQASSYPVSTILLFIWIAGLTAIIVSLLIEVGRILLYFRGSVKIRRGNTIIIYSNRVKSPFSFFSYIFIPEYLANTREAESIIVHESVHSAQYHSADNLVTGFITALMWFNPAVWMLRKSLHLVHEYLADQGTIDSGIELTWYQSLLVNQVAEEKLINIPSGFNNNLIKNRIIMMTKAVNRKSKRRELIPLVLVTIILSLGVSVYNGLYGQDTKTDKKKKKDVIKEEAVKEITVVGYSTIKDSVKERIVTGYPLNKGKDNEIIVIGQPLEKGKCDEITVIGYKTGSKDQEAKVVIGHKLDSTKDEPVTVIGYKTIRDTARHDVVIREGKNLQLPDSVIYVVDGVHVKSIKKLNPYDIESITVMKEDNIVIIRTKGYARESDITIKENQLGSIPENVIFMIDGKVSDKSELEKLNPNQIESLTVIKGKDKVKEIAGVEGDSLIIVKTKQVPR